MKRNKTATTAAPMIAGASRRSGLNGETPGTARRARRPSRPASIQAATADPSVIPTAPKRRASFRSPPSNSVGRASRTSLDPSRSNSHIVDTASVIDTVTRTIAILAGPFVSPWDQSVF